MSEKSFCYLNGYAVKDQTARADIELLKTGKVSNEGLAIAIETVNNSVDTVDGRVTSLSSRIDTISNTVNAHESATGIAYSGTASGLAAATVQAAIDELAADVSVITPDSATGITYSGTTSGLAATNVQAAIDELAADVDATIDGIVTEMEVVNTNALEELVTIATNLWVENTSDSRYPFSATVTCSLDHNTPNAVPFGGDSLLTNEVIEVSATVPQFLYNQSTRTITFYTTMTDTISMPELVFVVRG